MTIPFPETLEATRILYFPNGIYTVSNTITYSYFENMMSIRDGAPYMELNRQIHFKGESTALYTPVLPQSGLWQYRYRCPDSVEKNL